VQVSRHRCPTLAITPGLSANWKLAHYLIFSLDDNQKFTAL
jgi:hypothetical protein